MPGETTITIQGNLTAEPDLRVTTNGVPVAVFTVASTTRVLDRASSQWRDGDAIFLRCTAWRALAEHVAELSKGTRVIVSGRIKQHAFQSLDGERRTVTELEVDDIGPSLRYARARVIRVRPSGPEPAWTGDATASDAAS